MREPQHRERGVEPLLLELHGLEYPLDDAGARRADPLRPAPDSPGVPVRVRPPVRQVGLVRRVPVARVCREQRVGREPLSAQEDLDGGLSDAQVDRPADGEMGHRVEVALVRHVAVALDLAPVHPLADLVGRRRQRPQERAFLLLEDLPPRALPFGEGAGVVLVDLLPDGLLERAEVREDRFAQRRYHLGGRLPHLVLHAGLVARPPHARGHHRRPVMGCHLPVCVVDDDLALAGMALDARLEVVRHDAGGRAAEVAECVHVAAKPCILLHVERRLDPRHAAEGQAGHEQVDLGDLARRRVDDRHRRPGPVDLHDPSRLVPDAAHDAFPHGELAVALAEAVVTHRRLAPRGARVPVLGVQALERHPVAGELPVDALPVGIGVDGGLVRPLGEKAVVDLAVRERAGVLPPEALPLGRGEHRGHAVARHAEGRCDGAPRQPGPVEPQDVLGPDSIRHAENLLRLDSDMARRR